MPAPKKASRSKKPENYKETDEVLNLLREAFAIDATIDEACFYAGINPDTYYRWKKDNPSRYSDLERLRNTPVLAARKTLAKAVTRDAKTAMDYLQRKRKDEFSTKSETDITTAGQPVAAPVVRIIDERQRHTDTE